MPPLPPRAEAASVAPPEVRAWWLLLVGAAIVRALIMPYGGFPTDIGTFKAWASALAQHGPAGFYREGFVDYLPGYLYVLWGIGELHAALRLNDQALLFAIKLPAAVCDIATAVLIRWVAERFTSRRMALWLGALYLFHPALIFTGAYWGQVDSVGAFLALSALALFLRGHPLAWSAAALAFLVKPQTAPLILVLAVAMLRRDLWPAPRPEGFRPRPDRVIGAALLGGATVVLLLAPFGLGPTRLVTLMRTAINVYPYGSVVAFNLWGAIQGFWQSDAARLAGLPVFLWGILAAVLAVVVILAVVWRRPQERTTVVAASAVLLAIFLLSTRMHERYLIPALPFLALLPAVDRRLWVIYGGLSGLLLLNLVYAYTRPYVQTFLLPALLERSVFSDPAIRVFSAVAVATLPWLVAVMMRPREIA